MTEPTLRELLQAHQMVGSAPPRELEWLLAHGTERRYAKGENIVVPNDAADFLFVVLAGHIDTWIDRGSGPRKVNVQGPGDVTGLLPYSRLAISPATVVATEDSIFLAVPKALMPALIRECPVLTEQFVHVMIDRARKFTSADLRDEKMVSLGRLSAGLAHELNNPASAASRSAGLLVTALAEADEAAQTLGAAGLSAAQLAAVHALRATCGDNRPAVIRSAIARADREDQIVDWLTAHHIDDSAAATLTETPVTLADMDALAAALDGPALDAAVRWIAAGCTAHALALDIQRATTRIYDLVGAVKRITYMDRAPSPEPVDVGRLLADTIAVLGSKARGRSLEVTLDVAADVPPARGVGGELNQVWMNLLDNALDAAPESGHVAVRVTRELSRVVVSIVDDGPGIDPAIRERIFDPFFTTKPVGSGTGLGLDLTRQIIRSHQGDIEVDSRPGRTEFRVSLPAATVGAA